MKRAPRTYNLRKKQGGFILNPFAAASPSLVLDLYPTGIWGAYGLTKLRTAYSGSAIRVRRTSDDSEQDIGFVGNDLDWATLESFVAGNDGAIRKWYDQSGGGNDLGNATNLQQPLIIKTGVDYREIVFNGIDDFLATVNSSAAVAAFSVYAAGRNRYANMGSSKCLIAHNSGAGIFTLNDSGFTVDRHGVRLYNDGTTGQARYEDAATHDNACHAAVFDRSQATVAAELAYYVNGTAQSQVSTSGSAVSSTYATGVWRVGSIDGSTQYEAAAHNTILIYEAAHSSGTVGSISALLQPSQRVSQLDSYTTNLWGLYSLRKQISSYAGSCLRLRDVTADTETDIGFDANGIIDWAAAISYLAGHTGVVAKFYDQSGGGNHFEQGTESVMPVLIVAGVPYYEGLYFDGARAMSSVNPSGTPTGITAYTKALATAHDTMMLLELSASIGSNTGAALYYEHTSTFGFECIVSTTTSANMVYSRYGNTSYAGQPIGVRWDRSLSGSAKVGLNIGGVLQTRSGNADGGIQGDNFAAKTWYLGARAASSNFFQGHVHTLAIYETGHSDADMLEITRGIG